MKKLQYIVDEEGERLGVVLSLEEYELLLEYKIGSYVHESEGDYLVESKSATIEDLTKAKALYELYRNSPPYIRAQFYELISREIFDQNEEGFSALSEDSFAEIWNAPENNHWDQFIKDRLNV